MEDIATAESVAAGHPDKVADQISDAVLDAVLCLDPNGRVACEAMVTTGLVVVTGEISTEASIDIADIARRTIVTIGYDSDRAGFNGNTCGIIVSVDKQCERINAGVTASYEHRTGASSDPLDALGAGDQGVMVGYACDDTPELMPAAIWLAQRLGAQLTAARRNGRIPYLLPDGKTQVSIAYSGGRPIRLLKVLVAAHHTPGVARDALLQDIQEHVVGKAIPDWLDSADSKLAVNMNAPFDIGGPQADTGLTGRKIIADSYGTAARHGGGAYSGKDPTKVDRSAAYAARWIAKHVVASEAARRCEVELAYASGMAEPFTVAVRTFGTEQCSIEAIGKAIEAVFDLRPSAIIRDLDLRRPIYSETAVNGHFGWLTPERTWETTSRLTDFAKAL